MCGKGNRRAVHLGKEEITTYELEKDFIGLEASPYNISMLYDLRPDRDDLDSDYRGDLRFTAALALRDGAGYDCLPD